MKMWPIIGLVVLVLIAATIASCWNREEPYVVENVTNIPIKSIEMPPVVNKTPVVTRNQTNKVTGAATSKKSRDGSSGGSSGSDGPAVDNSARLELQSMLTRTSREFRIEYELKTTLEGQTTSSKTIEHVKGEEKIRSDLINGATETRTYFVDDALTTCSHSGSEWECARYDVSGEEGINTNVAAQLQQFDVQRDGSMEIAGVNTSCYKVYSSAEESAVRYCFTTDALPLYVLTQTPEFTSEMTATTYSTTVADAEFELPEGADVEEYTT
jgi:hypothetical protein